MMVNKEEREMNLMQQRSNLSQAYASGDKEAVDRTLKIIMILEDDDIKKELQELLEDHGKVLQFKEQEVNALIRTLGKGITIESFISTVESMKETITRYNNDLNTCETDFWSVLIGYYFKHE